jgi:integrase
MKLIKRGPMYWVDFRDPSGKRHRISTGERDEAAGYEKAGNIVHAAMVKPVTAPVDPRLTLSAALETTWNLHWSRTKSGDSMRHTVNLLQREMKDVKLADVQTKMLRTHCERWFKEGLSPATVNRRMSTIGVVLTREAEDDPKLVRPKLPHFAENNTKERYMTAAEEIEILKQINMRKDASTVMDQSTTAGEWAYMRDFIVFLLDTGFRFSELFKFTVIDDYADLGHGTTKAGTTRRGDGRRVPLTTRALEAATRLKASPIHERLAALTEKKSWEFCGYRFRVAAQAAGCGDITIHILRHTCASRLVQRGVPIYTVSKWLGHSSVKVTERYAKLAPDSLSMARAALEIPATA